MFPSTLLMHCKSSTGKYLAVLQRSETTRGRLSVWDCMPPRCICKQILLWKVLGLWLSNLVTCTQPCSLILMFWKSLYIHALQPLWCKQKSFVTNLALFNPFQTPRFLERSFFRSKRPVKPFFWTIPLLSITFCLFYTSPNSSKSSEFIFCEVWGLWKMLFWGNFCDHLTSPHFGCLLWRTV